MEHANYVLMSSKDAKVVMIPIPAQNAYKIPTISTMENVSVVQFYLFVNSALIHKLVTNALITTTLISENAKSAHILSRNVKPASLKINVANANPVSILTITENALVVP